MRNCLSALLVVMCFLLPRYSLASISEDVNQVIDGHASSITDAGKLASELSKLTSFHLYHLDDKNLNKTLLVMFEANSRLKAVKVTDYATQEVFSTIYRDESNNLVRGDIPNWLSRYQSAKVAVSHDGEVIGLLEIRFQSAEEAKRLGDFSKFVIMLVVIFALFFVLMLVIGKQLSKSVGVNMYLTFGTEKFARLIIGAISAFVLISCLGSWLILEHNKDNIMANSSDSFHQYLMSLNKTLNNIHDIRGKTFQHILSKSDFQRYLHELLAAIDSDDEKAASYYRIKMADLWSKYREFSRDGAKMILSPRLDVLYSQGAPIDYSNLYYRLGDPFSQALAGKSVLLPIEVSNTEAIGVSDYRMIFVTPVFDNFDSNVIALAIIEIEDREISYHDFSSHNFSDSGEMMAFDRDGNLLSSPRFVSDSDNVSNERLFIRDMLDKLSLHGLDNDLAGIHEVVDYRGEETYAMLRWNNDLNVALVAKMDADEILSQYYTFKVGLYIIVFVMISFTATSLLFTLYAGHESNRRLKASRREIINRLGHAAEFKDNETALHIFRMSRYTEILARNLDMPAAWIDLVSEAAPMHDIGKIGVPDAVLQKPGKLTAEEWEVMKKHPTFGADIIGEHSGSQLLTMAREIALCHHEKWDGTGYPYGIAGETIPMAARIVAIADVFDALTSERPYKKAWPFDAAVTLIVSESGKHFDPEVVNVFRCSLTEFKYVMVNYNDEQLKDRDITF